ncbi:hypothetical protein ACFL4T_03885 [candidate division KSB1 bacterium]
MKFRLSIPVLLVAAFLFSIPIRSQERKVTYNSKKFELYPVLYDKLPDVPSPFTAENGTEIITAYFKDNKYALIPVTVENGEPMNYEKGQWGKGDQLKSDEMDFPVLAKTGLHSEAELDQTRMITGKSIAEITELGRPERSSGAGFMASDEDIISVIKGDNRLVKSLGLTHPKLAKPLFYIVNLLKVDRDTYRKTNKTLGGLSYILYNGSKVYLKWEGAKGWQQSIFNDEVLGYYQINIRRELDNGEREFLRKKYSNLTDEQMKDMIKMLTNIYTGEMVPYYIMRYGFYEGHTGYRTDPVAAAFVFGLKSIREIEKSFPGELYNVLTKHFTRE